jgi:hypothetical protein
MRLKRAIDDRLVSVSEYYAAVRSGDTTTLEALAARCRETDEELTEAMHPFTVPQDTERENAG